MRKKLMVDGGMAIAMLLLMTYGRIGEMTHEWLGLVLLGLVICHHVLNRKWYHAVENGRYTPIRIAQTALVGLIFLCVIGSVVSGIILSRYVFSELPVHKGYALAGKLHILCSYWGFVLMALHLGFYWNRILAAARKHITLPSAWKWVLRCLAFAIAGYGVYGFIRRDIGIYLLLKSHFVFIDYAEPLIYFMIDYISIASLFVLFGSYLSKAMRTNNRNQKQNKR